MSASPHRYVKAMPIHSKSDAYEMCCKVFTSLDRNRVTIVKNVHDDDAEELPSLKLALRNMGSELSTSSPCSRQSNGLSEKLIERFWIKQESY